MELPNISRHSPNLAGALRRAEVKDAQMLDQAFGFALEHGGLTELDFEREEDVSFNPRPARVALILLRDAHIKESEVLTAAMLATAHADLTHFRSTLTAIPGRVCELAILAQAEPEILEEKASASAGKIAAALHLDRARHRHLARDPEKLLRWEEFIQLTEQFAALADRVSPELAVLLSAWHRRATVGASKSE